MAHLCGLFLFQSWSSCESVRKCWLHVLLGMIVFHLAERIGNKKDDDDDDDDD